MSDENEQVYVAAASGNMKRLAEALAAGGDPNAESSDGPTPLVIAARGGFVEGVRALLAAGADPGAPASWFGSPLRHAAAEGHLEAARILIEAGASLVSRSDREGPLLVWAVEADEPEMIRCFVAAGADVNARNGAGQSALIASAIKGKARAAATLLELGADPALGDGMHTAVEWAREKGHDEVVALLEGRKAAAEVEAVEPDAPTYRYVPPAGRWLEVDGVVFEEGGDDTAFVRGLLAGREPLGLHDHYPYDRLQRLWNRLEEVQARLEKATAACLDDRNTLVRSQALMFFRERPDAEGAERIEELAEVRPELFAGVPDPKSPDQTLEWTLLEALGGRARLAHAWRARDLAEKRVLEPGKADPLMRALPDDWLARYAEEIERATPAAAPYLREVKERVAAAAPQVAAADDEEKNEEENGMERDLRQAPSLSAYRDLLVRYPVVLNATGGSVTRWGFPALLRAFRWSSPDQGFEEVLDACRALLPALGGYLIHKAQQGVDDATHPVPHISRMTDVLAALADGRDVPLPEDVEPETVIALGCALLEAELAGITEDLLRVAPLVADKERELKEGAGPGLAALLQLSVAERVARLKDCVSALTLCKNVVYNLVRAVGDRVLPAIEEQVWSLAPADQDYLLHGLDAFAGSAAVLAFYDRFLEATTSPYLDGHVRQYRQRVQAGLKTTGWERTEAPVEDDPSGAALYQAGLAAYNGDGREKDDAEAFRLHGEAARRGHADALFELHIFYTQGIGCEVDLQRAAECLREAAERGQPRACYNLGAFHATGSQPAIPRDEEQSVRWYGRAADAGHGRAAAVLAAMHLTGEGAPRSIERFHEMLLRSVELGFDAAGFLASMGLQPPSIPQ